MAKLLNSKNVCTRTNATFSGILMRKPFSMFRFVHFHCQSSLLSSLSSSKIYVHCIKYSYTNRLYFWYFLRFRPVPTIFFSLFSLGLLFFIFFVYLSLKIVCQTIRMNRFTACTLYIALTRKNAKCSNKFLQTVIIILSVAFFSLFHSLCLSLFLSICASTAVVHSFCGNLTQTCCYCRSFFIHFDNKLAVLTWLYASVHFGLPLWCAVSISVLEFLVSI